MSISDIVAVSLPTTVSSMIYSYHCYKKKQQNRIEFILLTLVIVLVPFTLYLAGNLPD